MRAVTAEHQQAAPPAPPAQEGKSYASVEEEVDRIFSSSQETRGRDVEGLIPVQSRVPQRYRAIIPYEYFNRIQSATCDSILSTNKNIVISAPTVVLPFPCEE